MDDKQYKRLGHFIRWVLELSIIWVYVLPEIGMWTCIMLTLMTVGMEANHLRLLLLEKSRWR